MAELVFGMSAVFALPRRLLGLRMWTIHAAPWKGKRAVSPGGVEECVNVKQASVTSFEAMQPSGCRGVQAGVQAADSSRGALRWQVRGRRASRARAAGLQCT
eukprot:scaffold2973_cov114-Isochrysis_galbana.AAC.3